MLLQNNTIAVLQESFSDIIRSMMGVLPGLIKATLLLIIGYIIAKYAALAIKKLLISINADKAVEKLSEIEIFSKMDFKLSEVLSKMVFWLVIFVFLTISADVLNLEVVSNGIASMLGYIPKILMALVLFFVGVFAANLIRGVIVSTTASMNIPAGKLLASVVFYFLVLVFGVQAMGQAGVDTSMISSNINNVVMIFLAALGLGYGISSKDLMSNTLAGIYTKNKFRVGQEIEYKGTVGTIVEIDSNSAIIKRVDGSKIVIPLAKFLQEDIIIINDFEEQFVDGGVGG